MRRSSTCSPFLREGYPLSWLWMGIPILAWACPCPEQQLQQLKWALVTLVNYPLNTHHQSTPQSGRCVPPVLAGEGVLHVLVGVPLTLAGTWAEQSGTPSLRKDQRVPPLPVNIVTCKNLTSRRTSYAGGNCRNSTEDR